MVIHSRQFNQTATMFSCYIDFIADYEHGNPSRDLLKHEIILNDVCKWIIFSQIRGTGPMTTPH